MGIPQPQTHRGARRGRGSPRGGGTGVSLRRAPSWGSHSGGESTGWVPGEPRRILGGSGRSWGVTHHLISREVDVAGEDEEVTVRGQRAGTPLAPPKLTQTHRGGDRTCPLRVPPGWAPEVAEVRGNRAGGLRRLLGSLEGFRGVWGFLRGGQWRCGGGSGGSRGVPDGVPGGGGGEAGGSLWGFPGAAMGGSWGLPWGGVRRVLGGSRWFRGPGEASGDAGLCLEGVWGSL